MKDNIAGVFTRRDFLKAAGVYSAGFGLACMRLAEMKQPNILMILVDDLGYGDLNSFGAADLRTPHVDGLMAAGMRFNNFYANSPVCSPTRAALLSGRYQDMVGVPGVIRTNPGNSWGYLDPGARLMPDLLREAGYSTALVGKWHLGLSTPNTPNERGFDFFHGFLGDMMDDYYSHRRHGHNYMRRNQQEIDHPGHATDLFSQWACDYISEQEGGKPFFLYLAYNAPHVPVQPPEEWLVKVKEREPGIEEKRARLVAFIEHLDHGIGRVLTALKDKGLEDKTLVIFTSDNGGQLSAGANNGSLRAGKGTLYEGGIRVPAGIRWPGVVEPGTACDRVTMIMDIMPTLVEAAGGSVDFSVDGHSFLRSLSGDDQPAGDRLLFFGRREGREGHAARVFNKSGTVYGVRKGDWKLLQPGPGQPLELYHLGDDPLEHHDLADSEPEKYNELFEKLRGQLDRYAAVPWQPPE